MYRMSATECQVKNLLRISGGSGRFGGGALISAEVPISGGTRSAETPAINATVASHSSRQLVLSIMTTALDCRTTAPTGRLWHPPSWLLAGVA